MRNTVVFFILIIATLPGLAQPSWKLVKEKNGIKVFTANSEQSKFKSIRVQGVFDGTISKLIRIVTDVKGHPGWVYKAKNTQLVKQLNPNELLYYTQSSMPWPVNDRDVVVHLTIHPDVAHHVLKMNSFSEEGSIQKQKGIVRIPYLKASWYVTESANKINIDYTFQVDPGGTLPPWLVNLLADKGPYETFHNLEELLRE
jgi:hypothetical protein